MNSNNWIVIFYGVITLVISGCSDVLDLTSFDNLVEPKIILVLGQSNTHSGDGLDPLLDNAQAGVYQLGRFDNNNYKVIPAAEPLDHHSKWQNRVGFALTFAKLLHQRFKGNHDIVIVPCGSRGTGFIDNRWNKSDDLYEDALNRTITLLKRIPNSELSAILWHQGEKDINNTKYKYQLDEFINDLRMDLGNPTIPFILGGMVPQWVNEDPVRVKRQKLLKSTPLRHTNVGYADPMIPFVIERRNLSSEKIHFDAYGQRELGKRYFDVYLNMVN